MDDQDTAREIISIHALREEGDPLWSLSGQIAAFYFYPRPPRGGRRGARREVWRQYIFLSTPSARRATAPTSVCAVWPKISIHALREEGDLARRVQRDDGQVISIHALREEGDPPTPPSSRLTTYFYPRPPRGGRQVYEWSCKALGEFLSTPSARRATPVSAVFCGNLLISIHALREEGDPARCSLPCPCANFYPRPPRGGRLASRSSSTRTSTFLSTPSARRATEMPTNS